MDRGHDVCWAPGWVVSNPENISPRSCGRSARCDQGRLQHRDCGCVITTEGMRRARKMTKRRIERRLKCRGRRKGPGARCNPPRSLRGEGRLMLSSRAIPEFIWECSAVRHSLGFGQACTSFGIFCSSAYFRGMRAQAHLPDPTRRHRRRWRPLSAEFVIPPAAFSRSRGSRGLDDINTRNWEKCSKNSWRDKRSSALRLANCQNA